MSKRVQLQPAYVLHRRAYRETSFLIELFALEYGRLTVIARGVRKTLSAQQGLLQPFIPLLVSWSGKTELLTLTHVEASGEIKYLHGECLFAGFYLNELLICLLQKWDAYTKLYLAYEKALYDLQTNHLEQKTLRAFEKRLLEEIGYGLLPKSNAVLQNNIQPDQYYRFIHEQGFILSDVNEKFAANIFSGKSLLAIAEENWHVPNCLQDAKRLTRYILTPLLGSRQLHSRRLFTSHSSQQKDEES